MVKCNLTNTHTHAQKDCNLDPFRYSAGLLKILKEFTENIAVLRARAVSFIDEIAVILPSELFLHGSYSGSQRMSVGMAKRKVYLDEP